MTTHMTGTREEWLAARLFFGISSLLFTAGAVIVGAGLFLIARAAGLG